MRENFGFLDCAGKGLITTKVIPFKSFIRGFAAYIILFANLGNFHSYGFGIF